MASLILSRETVDFLLFDWLAVDRLPERPRYAEHGRETFDAVLDLCETIAAEQFAPHNKLSDANEPRFENGAVTMIPEIGRALAAFRESGMFAAAADAELGGMQLPASIAAAGMAFFKAANIATAAYPMLTIAAANLLRAHGSAQQIDTYVRPMLEGRYFGTMALSEPQAGSSLADITTRAERQADGSWRLSGAKMWISGGEHDLSENIVHMVLARAAGAPVGVKGISLFVVPKFLPDGQRNDVVLAGLNHKMGYRGTTNTLLNFGEGVHRPDGAPGAVGFLVGEQNRGLAAMFHMMNEARIGVGMGAVALGYTGYLHALDYARTRLQGRVPGSDKAAPIIQHADVRRMLLAQKSYVEGGLALVLFCARLVDEERSAPDQAARHQAHALLELLTPIAKSWPSQWCLQANDLAIQIHGGYGYTRDYNVEQFYRDNRLNPIHEGTHGVQALDLLGRKVGQEGGLSLRLLLDRIAGTVGRAREQRSLAGWAGALERAAAELDAVTQACLTAPDPRQGLSNATAYLEAFGHLVVAWIWLQLALACVGRDDDFARGKRHACRYFFQIELPKIGPMLAPLRDADTTIADTDPAWF